MQSFADLNNTLLSHVDPDLAKAARASHVQRMFAESVLEATGSLTTARYLLSHVQAVYVMRDDAPRRNSEGKPPILLRIYSDDSTVRAELDARQEWIRMSLARRDIRYDRMRLHASNFGMKKRKTLDKFLELGGKVGAADSSRDVERHHLDEHAIDTLASHVGSAQVARAMQAALEATAADEAPAGLSSGGNCGSPQASSPAIQPNRNSGDSAGAGGTNKTQTLRAEPEETRKADAPDCAKSTSRPNKKERRIMVDRLEVLKRAFCLVFGTGADAVLARVNAAYLTPVPRHGTTQGARPAAGRRSPKGGRAGCASSAKQGAAYEPAPSDPKRDNATSECYESCHCVLYSDDPRMDAVMEAYGDQVRKEARRLGLYIRGAIRVERTPAAIGGRRAFPPLSAPIIVDLPPA